MKTRISHSLLRPFRVVALCALGSSLALVSTANAATIVVDGSPFIATTGTTWSASMNNSNAFLKDDAGNLIADLTGTIVDYDFQEGGYKGAADVINPITFSVAGTRTNLSLWTESMDPLNDAAITTAGENGHPGGGSIDISTLSTGTVWLLTGTWAGTITINATMTDTDGILSDVVMTAYDQPDNGTRGYNYAFEMNFADAGDYEEISWTATGNYFTGVVVTQQVPESSSVLLIGLSSLLLLRRRRV